jgi:hypothetical protein
LNNSPIRTFCARENLQNLSTNYWMHIILSGPHTQALKFNLPVALYRAIIFSLSVNLLNNNHIRFNLRVRRILLLVSINLNVTTRFRGISEINNLHTRIRNRSYRQITFANSSSQNSLPSTPASTMLFCHNQTNILLEHKKQTTKQVDQSKRQILERIEETCEKNLRLPIVSPASTRPHAPIATFGLRQKPSMRYFHTWDYSAHVLKEKFGKL